MEHLVFGSWLIWHNFVEPAMRITFVMPLVWAKETEELLWMNGSTWAQLWSGAIGAVVGAGVAMHVLRTTLREQRAIAAKSEDLQRALAAKQLKEQRTALRRQLTEQRAALNRQLREQRREASLNREHAAIAEVLSVVTEAIRVSSKKSNEEDKDIQARFAAVAGRWMLETQDPSLRDELVRWPNLWSAAVGAWRDPHPLGLTREEGRKVLRDVVRSMLKVCNEWTHANSDERIELIAELAKIRRGTPRKSPEGSDGPKITSAE